MDARADRWHRLARLVVRRDLWPIWDLRECADCEHAEEYPEAARCQAEPRGKPLGLDWERCPFAELRASSHFRVAMELHAASQVSALAGWPREYAPWAVDAVLAIHAAIQDAQRAALERAKAGDHGGR